jgi:hypothetical protein
MKLNHTNAISKKKKKKKRILNTKCDTSGEEGKKNEQKNVSFMTSYYNDSVKLHVNVIIVLS